MMIASWNVAGLETTLKCIEKRHGSLGHWLERHQIDILCLQETKVDPSQITQNAKRYDVSGFESFWSCNRGTSQRKGLNGVATFAKKGMTTKAVRNVFSNKELDDEGRCICTIHGNVVILNVYTPNSANQARFEYKLRFLKGLSEAIANYKSKGFEVILLGDLNISYRPRDLHWKRRFIDLSKLPEIEESDKTANGLFASLVASIPRIEEVFQTRQVVSTAAGKYRAAFQFSPDGSHVAVGSSEFQEDYVGFKSYKTLFVDELMTISERLQLYPGRVAEWNTFSDDFGKSKSEPDSIKWLTDLIKSDDMVDSCIELYGAEATGRYACWNQVKNSRYRNEGSRIDYILVQRSLFEKGRCREAKISHLPPIINYSANETLALSECTASGQFKPAPVTGGGIPEAPDVAYEHQFTSRVPGSTGFIYTPPEYSDHAAITLAFPTPVLTSDLKLQTDAATKACQPHKAQPSILSFVVKRKREVQPPATKQSKKDTDVVEISD
eukprot:TRINITY_DN14013_c0_g1_i2.p2 TRINITY_DN14013_c0_g1~~TRINITY_DN14013_c0_g1_i2.p2  ORF type:complete len:497 (+),score=67.61 TRINITY_DN14013_c0_g1_i2:56-1546(+)